MYLVSVEQFETRGVGFHSLGLHHTEHVNEQRAVHLVCQVNGSVTLKIAQTSDKKDKVKLNFQTEQPGEGRALLWNQFYSYGETLLFCYVGLNCIITALKLVTGQDLYIYVE